MSYKIQIFAVLLSIALSAVGITTDPSTLVLTPVAATYASTLYANGSINSAGTIIPFSLTGSLVANEFFNIYCTLASSSTYLWGQKNIPVGATVGAAIALASTGTWLDSSYKTNYSITTNGYLGPNVDITNGTSTTFNVFLYQAAAAEAGTAISALATGYGSAATGNKATTSFTYQGTIVTLASSSFTTGGVLGSQYASTLNSNGSLNMTGTLPNFAMGGATVATGSSPSFYNIYCGTGSNYLWGSQNINATAATVTLQTSNTFLDSSYKTNYSIGTNSYLGPNKNMTGGTNTTYTVYLYSSTVSATTTSISAMATAYSASSFKDTASLTFIYASGYWMMAALSATVILI